VQRSSLDDLLLEFASGDPAKLRCLAHIKQTLTSIDHTPNHPAYPHMIVDAIETLDEASGSTKDAISEFIAAKYDVLLAFHPRKLTEQLEKLVEKERILLSGDRYMLLDEEIPLAKLVKRQTHLQQGGSGSEVRKLDIEAIDDLLDVPPPGFTNPAHLQDGKIRDSTEEMPSLTGKEKVLEGTPKLQGSTEIGLEIEKTLKEQQLVLPKKQSESEIEKPSREYQIVLPEKQSEFEIEKPLKEQQMVQPEKLSAFEIGKPLKEQQMVQHEKQSEEKNGETRLQQSLHDEGHFQSEEMDGPPGFTDTSHLQVGQIRYFLEERPAVTEKEEMFENEPHHKVVAAIESVLEVFEERPSMTDEKEEMFDEPHCKVVDELMASDIQVFEDIPSITEEEKFLEGNPQWQGSAGMFFELHHAGVEEENKLNTSVAECFGTENLSTGDQISLSEKQSEEKNGETRSQVQQPFRYEEHSQSEEMHIRVINAIEEPSRLQEQACLTDEEGRCVVQSTRGIIDERNADDDEGGREVIDAIEVQGRQGNAAAADQMDFEFLPEETEQVFQIEHPRSDGKDAETQPQIQLSFHNEEHFQNEVMKIRDTGEAVEQCQIQGQVSVPKEEAFGFVEPAKAMDDERHAEEAGGARGETNAIRAQSPHEVECPLIHPQVEQMHRAGNEAENEQGHMQQYFEVIHGDVEAECQVSEELDELEHHENKIIELETQTDMQCNFQVDEHAQSEQMQGGETGKIEDQIQHPESEGKNGLIQKQVQQSFGGEENEETCMRNIVAAEEQDQIQEKAAATEEEGFYTARLSKEMDYQRRAGGVQIARKETDAIREQSTHEVQFPLRYPQLEQIHRAENEASKDLGHMPQQAFEVIHGHVEVECLVSLELYELEHHGNVEIEGETQSDMQCNLQVEEHSISKQMQGGEAAEVEDQIEHPKSEGKNGLTEPQVQQSLLGEEHSQTEEMHIRDTGAAVEQSQIEGLVFVTEEEAFCTAGPVKETDDESRAEEVQVRREEIDAIETEEPSTEQGTTEDVDGRREEMEVDVPSEATEKFLEIEHPGSDGKKGKTEQSAEEQSQLVRKASVTEGVAFSMGKLDKGIDDERRAEEVRGGSKEINAIEEASPHQGSIEDAEGGREESEAIKAQRHQRGAQSEPESQYNLIVEEHSQSEHMQGRETGEADKTNDLQYSQSEQMQGRETLDPDKTNVLSKVAEILAKVTDQYEAMSLTPSPSTTSHELDHASSSPTKLLVMLVGLLGTTGELAQGLMEVISLLTENEVAKHNDQNQEVPPVAEVGCQIRSETCLQPQQAHALPQQNVDKAKPPEPGFTKDQGPEISVAGVSNDKNQKHMMEEVPKFSDCKLPLKRCRGRPRKDGDGLVNLPEAHRHKRQRYKGVEISVAAKVSIDKEQNPMVEEVPQVLGSSSELPLKRGQGRPRKEVDNDPLPQPHKPWQGTVAEMFNNKEQNPRREETPQVFGSSTELPLKRGPGRPRKDADADALSQRHKPWQHTVTEVSNDNEQNPRREEIPQVFGSSSELPLKLGPGRPRKDTNADALSQPHQLWQGTVAEVSHDKEQNPVREKMPQVFGSSSELPLKRGPGRPRKDVNTAALPRPDQPWQGTVAEVSNGKEQNPVRQKLTQVFGSSSELPLKRRPGRPRNAANADPLSQPYHPWQRTVGEVSNGKEQNLVREEMPQAFGSSSELLLKRGPGRPRKDAIADALCQPHQSWQGTVAEVSNDEEKYPVMETMPQVIGSNRNLPLKPGRGRPRKDADADVLPRPKKQQRKIPAEEESNDKDQHPVIPVIGEVSQVPSSEHKVHFKRGPGRPRKEIGGLSQPLQRNKGLKSPIQSGIESPIQSGARAESFTRSAMGELESAPAR
ncbi:hypothetical protein Tsubulata_024260, partial [Turnera subulata]